MPDVVDFLRDLRLAVRFCLKAPTFTAAVVLSLALGIGANTAVFTLVNDALLRSLPVKNPDELVLFRTTEGRGGQMSRGGENVGFDSSGRFSSTSFSLLTFERLRAARAPLTDVFAFAPFSQVNVIVDGSADVDASAQFVSGNYHEALGVPAAIGRTLTPDDDRTAATPVATISDRYWARRFARSPGVIGQAIAINRVAVTIVGVTPEGFNGTMQAGESPDLSVALAQFLRFQPDRGGRARPSYWWIRIMGRLAPGATPAQASAALEPIFQETAREGWILDQPPAGGFTSMPDPPTLTADSGAQGENDARRQFARPLQVLMGLAGLVLVAACANVANLLLARGVARQPEMALRLAIGASRARLVRQLLAEPLLLAAGGATLGIALASSSRHLLLALRPFGKTTPAFDLPLDAHVLGFAIAATVLTAGLFGLAPVLRATRVDLSTQFQGPSRTLGGGRPSNLTRTLMVVQIALSLVLLVSTGLFVRTLDNLQRVDVGFDRTNLVLFRIDATSAGYPAAGVVDLQTRVQDRLQGVPGVRAVTYSSVALLSQVRQNKRVVVSGQLPSAGAAPIVDTNGLAPNFFEAMRLPILRGRAFTERDDQRGPRVAVVNQAFMRRYVGDSDPLGRTLTIGAAPDDIVEIVGVSADAKYREIRADAPPTIYLPARQRIDGQANYAIRMAATDRRGMTAAQEGAAFAAVRAVVRDLDPALPVLDLRTQEDQVTRLNAEPLLFARLSGLFGLLAIVLAAVGLYGQLAHAIARRTAEIGLRMALGAGPAGVFRMIVLESLAIVGVGLGLGAVAAYLAVRLVANVLFGLSAVDPPTYAVAGAVLTAVGLLASMIPARRASLVEPATALKRE